jgi:hypothetical protein
VNAAAHDLNTMLVNMDVSVSDVNDIWVHADSILDAILFASLFPDAQEICLTSPCTIFGHHDPPDLSVFPPLSNVTTVEVGTVADLERLNRCVEAGKLPNASFALITNQMREEYIPQALADKIATMIIHDRLYGPASNLPWSCKTIFKNVKHILCDSVDQAAFNWISTHIASMQTIEAFTIRGYHANPACKAFISFLLSHPLVEFNHTVYIDNIEHKLKRMRFAYEIAKSQKLPGDLKKLLFNAV